MVNFDLKDVNWDLISKEVDIYFKKLFPINRSILNSGVLTTYQILQEVTKFETIEIPTGTICYDWEVPEEWEIEEAYISDLFGNVIIDFKENNLHVLNYSDSVDGIINFSELENHLYYIKQLPDAIPYKTSYYKKDWGFCLTYNQFIKLERDKNYYVKIKSSFKQGAIRIGEHIVKGESSEEILISAYSCHPSLANDSLSGVLLWVFLLRELKKMKKLKYTYRFVLLPETIGAISYLALKENEVKINVKRAFVITTVAGPGSFGYKFSFKTNDFIDRCVLKTFKEEKIEFIPYSFDIHGSDERQYSSQFFRIPCGTISKDKYYEYKEYHTSLDNLDFVKAEYLVESMKLYLLTIQKLELHSIVYKSLNSKCEPFLRKRNLFPHIGITISNHNVIDENHEITKYKIGNEQKIDGADIDLVLWIMFYSDGLNNLLDISEKSGLPLKRVYFISELLVKEKLLKLLNC